MYVLKFTAGAVENIKEMPKGARNALRKKLETIVARDPESCSESLTGPLAGYRSYHFDERRIVFRIFDDLNAIAVVGVGLKMPVPGIYERLEALAHTGKLADSVLSTLRMFR